MIISKCPLRISLVGGSTDLEDFISKYDYGSVISFPSNLYCYITLHQDVLGQNQKDKKFIINYLKREEVETITEIKNDVARECLMRNPQSPLTIGFTSDIYSANSGLAASTSYTIALISALKKQSDHPIDEHEICWKAIQIERGFNPLTGRQDAFGCGLPLFKRLHFHKNQSSAQFLDSKIITEQLDLFLIGTYTTRKSTNILSTLDLKKAKKLLKFVDALEEAIKINDVEWFCELINQSWEVKKTTSKEIVPDELADLDYRITKLFNFKARKLLGAGGGGYFLVMLKKDESNDFVIKSVFPNNSIKINYSPENKLKVIKV
jgi:D-glycero-alpha-D-manno-heptose-7-phosphate kinase